MVTYPCQVEPSPAEAQRAQNIGGEPRSGKQREKARQRVTSPSKTVTISDGDTSRLVFFFHGKLIPSRSLGLSISTGNCVHFQLK